MVHYNLLRISSEQPDVLLKALGLPKLHVVVDRLPSNGQNSRLTLHALLLELFVRNAIRGRKKPIRLLFIHYLGKLLDVRLVVRAWRSVEVEECNLSNRSGESLVQGTFWFEIGVAECDWVSVNDG